MSWYRFYLRVDQIRPAKVSFVQFSSGRFLLAYLHEIITYRKRKRENSIELIVRLPIGDR